MASHRNEITAWSRLESDVRRYEYRVDQAAGYTQPEHVTALLGPLPERVGPVERWQSAAGAIEAYRTRWNIDGSDTRGEEADVSALVAEQRRRDEWVASHRDEITAWVRLDRDVRRSEYRLGQAASYTQPEHVTALLGPLPERIGHVERWQSAAGAIEAYRTRWKIGGPATVGPEPADPVQRTHWDKTVAIVGQAGFLTAGDTREGGSERASLATRWRNIHTANHQGDDNRSVAEATIPSPASLWSDEPDFDNGLDGGFSF